MVKMESIIKNLFSTRKEEQKDQFEQALISEVMARPLLYDKVNPNYMKTQLVANAWTEIGKKIGFCPIENENKTDIDAQLCKTKWKKLKDYFLKLARKGPEHSGDSQDMNVEVVTWKWFTSMLFLKDVNHPQPTIDTLDLTTAGELTSMDTMSTTPSPIPATPGPSTGIHVSTTPTILAYTNKRKSKGTDKGRQWGEVAEKITKILDEKETIDQSFSNYICSEMGNMNSQRKKAFKTQVFDLLNKINDDEFYDD